MNKKFLVTVMAILLGGASFFYTALAGADEVNPSSGAEIGVRIGQALPEITLEGLDGSSVTVGQKGKIVVINFWATWCPPCRDEMPELNSFAQQNQEKVEFYAINLQEKNEKVSDFMNQNNYTMPTLLDKSGRIGKMFQVSAIPTTVIINKFGIIKHRKTGGMTKDELEGIINSM